MFQLSKIAINAFLNSDELSDEFKDKFKYYIDRRLSDDEVNEVLDLIINNIVVDRRIVDNDDIMIILNNSIGRVISGGSDVTPIGIRFVADYTQEGKRYSDSEIKRLKEDIIRKLIIERVEVLDLDKARDDRPRLRIKRGDEVKLSIDSTLEDSSASLRGLVHDTPADSSSGEDAATVARRKEMETLREDFSQLEGDIIAPKEPYNIKTITAAIDRLKTIEEKNNSLKAIDSKKIEKLKTDANQVLNGINEIIERFKNDLKAEESHKKELDKAGKGLQKYLAELEGIISSTDDEYIKNLLKPSVDLIKGNIESCNEGISESDNKISFIKEQISLLSGTPAPSRSDDSLDNQYNLLLSRIRGRDISEIGLEELEPLRGDMVSLRDTVQAAGNTALASTITTQLTEIDEEIDFKKDRLHEIDLELTSLEFEILNKERDVGVSSGQLGDVKKKISGAKNFEELAKYKNDLDNLKKQFDKENAELIDLQSQKLSLTDERKLIMKGGKLGTRKPIKSVLDSSLSPKDQVEALKNKYQELISKYKDRKIDEIGLDELKSIDEEYERLKTDISDYKKTAKEKKFDSELISELDTLFKDVSNSKNDIHVKYNQKSKIYDKLMARKRELEANKEKINKLINVNLTLIEKLNNNLKLPFDEKRKEQLQNQIKDLNNEIEKWKPDLAKLEDEIGKIDYVMSVVKNGGNYRSLVDTGKPKKTGAAVEKPGDLVPPAGIGRPTPSGLPMDVVKAPKVKYNKPKLTWKTALAVATGIGVGATVFFVAGPTGVAVMSVVNGIALKVVGKARAKAAANRMIRLGVESEVESIEEPKKGIKGAIDRFKKYIKSEEGLRDISWMLTSAIITGNALSIGNAIRSKMIANKASTEIVSEPKPTPASSNPTVEPTSAAPTDTSSVAQVTPTSSTPAPTTATPTSATVAPTTPTPTPVNDVYSGIRLGDNVGGYNVSVGHRQATKAFGGWDPLNLNQNLVNSDSVFSEFAIVDDSGKLLGRVGTPGLTLDEVCAQYGVNYSNIVLDVTKNGTPQAWISVEELVKGVSVGGPTI